MPLPVVSAEIAGPLRHEARSIGSDKFIDNMIDKLIKENPVIAAFLEGFAPTTNDPGSVSFAVLLVYKLLENQQEADELKKAIG